MTVALADGPLGLEATHVWTSGGFGTPTFTLNDLSGTPRVKVTKITGWRSAPEIESIAINRYGRMGENTLALSPRGTTKVYEFTIKEKTAQAFRQTTSALLAAFSERSELGTMRVKPKSPYGDPDDHWYFKARVMQLDIDESLDGNLNDPHGFWTASGQLGLHLFDPRFYWNDLIDTGAVAAPVTVTNSGNIEVNPQITIVTSSSLAPTIGNSTIGRTIEFDQLPFGTWVIDFDARNVYDATDPTTTGYPYLVGADWWRELVPGLVPGANVITASGVDSIQVTHHHGML